MVQIIVINKINILEKKNIKQNIVNISFTLKNVQWRATMVHRHNLE